MNRFLRPACASLFVVEAVLGQKLTGLGSPRKAQSLVSLVKKWTGRRQRPLSGSPRLRGGGGVSWDGDGDVGALALHAFDPKTTADTLNEPSALVNA